MKRKLLLIVVFYAASSAALADSNQDLVRLHYDLEVASYCGLVNEKALNGFNRSLQQTIAVEKLTRKDIEEARMQAWKEAHWEWENRGLGGFKSWCANEGKGCNTQTGILRRLIDSSCAGNRVCCLTHILQLAPRQISS